MLLDALTLIVFVYALLSWIPNVDRNNPIIKFISTVAEFLCAPVRKLIPPKNTGNIDLSPLIVILVISAISRFI